MQATMASNILYSFTVGAIAILVNLAPPSNIVCVPVMCEDAGLA